MFNEYNIERFGNWNNHRAGARMNSEWNINETRQSGANTITERRTAGEEQRAEENDE